MLAASCWITYNIGIMKKQDAIKLFGETKDLASVLGITRQAIYQWPDYLNQEQIDRIIGAAIRVGIIQITMESGSSCIFDGFIHQA